MVVFVEVVKKSVLEEIQNTKCKNIYSVFTLKKLGYIPKHK